MRAHLLKGYFSQMTKDSICIMRPAGTTIGMINMWKIVFYLNKGSTIVSYMSSWRNKKKEYWVKAKRILSKYRWIHNDISIVGSLIGTLFSEGSHHTVENMHLTLCCVKFKWDLIIAHSTILCSICISLKVLRG